MPYISQEDRDFLNEEVQLVEYLRSFADILPEIPSGKIGGAFNYTVAQLFDYIFRPEGGWTYTSLAEALGHLDACKQELSRRLMGPLEDKAIAKNGDLDIFQ